MLVRWDDQPSDPAYYIEDCQIFGGLAIDRVLAKVIPALMWGFVADSLPL